MNADRGLQADIERTVDRLLEEDVGGGDLTAALVPEAEHAHARIVTREPTTVAGAPWVDAIFRRLDARVTTEWAMTDGAAAAPGDTLCSLHGPARALLTGERAALNILQTLSATATETARYVRTVADTPCQILDTRKTIPGLRLAQKYAVRCGGGTNHRTGLFDAILIKENHIASSGGIAPAVRAAADRHPGLPVEVEVEDLAELVQALDAGVSRILLDNFSLDGLREAVRTAAAHTDRQVALEASGNVTLETVRDIAATGVHYVSIGALTKNIRAIDLSMIFDS